MKDSKFQKTLRKMEFEDIYNPLKVYAYLRKGLDIPRERARELTRWYEDVFYKVVIKESDLIKIVEEDD